MSRIIKSILRELIKALILLTLVFIVGGIDDIVDILFRIVGM